MQEGVEGGDAVDLDGVDLDEVGDHLHGGAVDARGGALDVLEDGDEGAAAATVAIDERRDLGAELLLRSDVASESSPTSRAASGPCDQRLGLDRLGLELSTGTISSSLSMLRPMAALTLVSMMIGSVARLADLARHAEAVVGLFHHHVEDEQVGLVLVELLHALGPVRGAVDLVSLFLQDQPAGFDDVGVVVNDEDLGHRALLCPFPFPLARPDGAPSTAAPFAARTARRPRERRGRAGTDAE